MRKPHAALPRYTWDQAEILRLLPCESFRRFYGVPAGTLRRWASEGRIYAHGIGPNNVKLYLLSEVAELALEMKPAKPEAVP